LQLYAEALNGHLALARGDTAEAVQTFRSLRPIGSRTLLEWEIAEPLAVEKMQLARVLYALGDYAEARQVAEIFDHPQPIAFLPFLPASLELRYRSASAEGRRRLADTYRRRLMEIGMGDLVNDERRR
jgi:hypothetical protein